MGNPFLSFDDLSTRTYATNILKFLIEHLAISPQAELISTVHPKAQHCSENVFIFYPFRQYFLILKYALLNEIITVFDYDITYLAIQLCLE